MKKAIVIEIIVFLFILLFLYTGISKAIDYKQARFAMDQAPIIRPIAAVLTIAIPVVEIAVAFLLFVPRTKKVGLLCSLVLMILFTVYVAFMLITMNIHERPCACGGIIAKMNWNQHLIFNIAFTILAVIAIYLQRKRKREAEFEYSVS